MAFLSPPPGASGESCPPDFGKYNAPAGRLFAP